MKIKNIEAEDLEIIENQGLSYTFLASAPWCSSCRKLKKVIEDIDMEGEILCIDIDDNPDIAQDYKIRSLPALIYIDCEGGNVEIKTGYKNKQDVVDFLGF